MTARKLALTFTLLAGAAQAQSVQEAVELPSHRALMTVRGDTIPFVTDGCSGGLSDTWRVVADTFPGFADSFENKPPWEICCVVHDRAYHNASDARTAQDSFDARLTADQKLRSCVVASGRADRDDFAARFDVPPEQIDTAYETIAGAMFYAVRFGGGPCTGLPWRWGFGFDQCSIFDTMGKTAPQSPADAD
jgi:hypothetical protein